MLRIVLPLALLALSAACDGTSDPVTSPQTTGPAFVATSQSAALPDVDAATASETHPTVDLSRLEPALSSNFTWQCHFERRDEPVCIGSGPSPDNTNGWVPADPEAWVCGGSTLIYHNLTAEGKAMRRYDGEYRLADRTVHWFGRDRYSLRADGTGKTASGELNFHDEFIYGTPADEATVTEVIRGTDSRAATDQPPHTLLFLNKGEVKFTPDGNLTILSGRWDFVTDFEGAIQRMCAALE